MVARQRHLRACAHMGVSDGGCASPQVENCVFLQLKSCNLVNTFRHKFRAGNGEKTVLWT